MMRGVLLPIITPFDEQVRVDGAMMRQLVDFHIGAGVQGLLHVSEMGWARVADASHVVKPGDEDLLAVDGATVERARLDPRNHEADRFASSRHLWSAVGRTVIAYGDVYYTADAMDTIVGDQTRSWRVYGRPKGSRLTGCTHGELFAFSWWPEQHAAVDGRLGYVIELRRSGVINRALGWELYRALIGHTGRDVRHPRLRRFDQLTVIDDMTEDFDKPKNYDTWMCRRSKCADVAVLVPWRLDGAHRDAAWAWVSARWVRHHPDWPIVEGRCPDGPWSKGAAVADALSRTTAQILVVADADVWCGEVAAAVDKVATGQARWAIPHRTVHRLTEHATADLIAGTLPYGRISRSPLEQAPYRGYAGGGITVIARDLLVRAPVDPRFVGWGQEDQAASLAWTALGGRPWRGLADLWHLWHPPQPRRSRSVGSAESAALFARYQAAASDPSLMRRLLADLNTEPAPISRVQRKDRPVSVRFISTRYPDLSIPTIGVRFRGGVAEVTTRGAIAYLQAPFMRRRGVRLATDAEVAAMQPAAAEPQPVAVDPQPPPAAEPAAGNVPQDTAQQPAAGQQPDAAPEAGSEPAETPAAEEDRQVPGGSANAVLAWVGDDRGRARRAIDAEQARPKPRTSLITRLTPIAASKRRVGATASAELPGIAAGSTTEEGHDG